jgi:Ca-activated chloride channel family protein
MGKLTFLNPEFFGCSLIPIAIWLFYKRNQQVATLNKFDQRFWGEYIIIGKTKPYLSVLRLIGLSSLIIALARPRTVDISNKTKQKE